MVSPGRKRLRPDDPHPLTLLTVLRVKSMPPPARQTPAVGRASRPAGGGLPLHTQPLLRKEPRPTTHRSPRPNDQTTKDHRPNNRQPNEQQTKNLFRIVFNNQLFISNCRNLFALRHTGHQTFSSLLIYCQPTGNITITGFNAILNHALA